MFSFRVSQVLDSFFKSWIAVASIQSLSLFVLRLWLHVGLLIMMIFLFFFGSSPLVDYWHEVGLVFATFTTFLFSVLCCTFSAFVIFGALALDSLIAWRLALILVASCAPEIASIVGITYVDFLFFQ